MTFFYDLNKKLADISAKPETKQLNERDEGKHNNAVTGFKALADKAAKEYGSKAAGKRVAGAVRATMAKAGKLKEADMEESAFQAAIGKQKYGEEGMKALQKAGREHASAKTMSNIRNKYDKYDESMDEGMLDSLKNVGKKIAGGINRAVGHGSDEQMRADLQKKMGLPPTGKKPAKPVGEDYGPLEEISAQTATNVAQSRLKQVSQLAGGDENIPWTVGASPAAGKLADKAEKAMAQAKARGATDADLEAGYEKSKKSGVLPMSPATQRNIFKQEPDDIDEGGTPMTPKQKKFAKITFADKIAGAKKEVDEMLGDVAAEAIKGALSPKQKKLDKNHNGKLDAQDFAMLRKGGKQETDEGSDWSQLGKEYSKPKVGTVTHGAKHDIEQTATGQRVTRRVDPNTGHSVGAEDDKPMDGEKRGRGRPKKADRAPERVTAKAYKHKGGRKVAEEDSGEHSDELKAAMAMLKKAGYKVTKDGEQELDEKAVSKAQQRFMGMVHATQKGEKAPSKEVAKVAKSMKKKDAEDFAATKHKGLPEKKKPEGKKKEKTEEAGGSGTPTASSGFSFGKGIYDSMNRELENMIAENMALTVAEGMGDDIVRMQYDNLVSRDGYTPEQAIMDIATRYKQDPEDIRRLVSGSTAQTPAARSAGVMKQARQSLGAMYEGLNESMSVNMSDSTEGGKSLTITATDDDAIKLADILRNAGLGGAAPEHSEVEVVGTESPISGDEGHDHGEPCETCGSADCGCGDVEEALAENEPDWPTDEVVSDDALQYSGGLNGPKSTGQTTVPVIANQGDRTGIDDEALRRLREAAGIAEQEQVREDAEAGNKEALAKEIYDLGYNIHQNDRYGQDTSQEEAKLKQLNAQFAQQFPGEDAFKIGSAINDREYAARQNQRNIQHQQDQEVAARTSNVMQKAKRGLGGMYEQEQVMAPESIDEAKEMCEVCEATPCKCDESVEESIARFRRLAGIQEAAKPDYIDLDKDGDKKESMKKAADDKEKEDKKVDESIFRMTNLWKAYKG